MDGAGAQGLDLYMTGRVGRLGPCCVGGREGFLPFLGRIIVSVEAPP